MPEEDLLIVKIENVKQRGKFYTLKLTVDEYDSLWDWKRKNYRQKFKRR